MTIEQAKKLSLYQLVRSLGYEEVKKRVNKKGQEEALFHSPLRQEKTPSFWVLTEASVFTDFGGRSGNILDFAMEYAKTDLSGALEWLSDRAGEEQLRPDRDGTKDRVKKGPSFELVSVKPIYFYPIKNYLRERRIPLELAARYLMEVDYKAKNGKAFKGIGMKNESGGYEVRSFGESKFHTSLNAKDISVIRGTKPGLANVFESAFDFLSFLVLAKLDRPDGDTFVLHSTSHAMASANRIKAENVYEEVRLWLDNDDAGTEATKAFLSLGNDVKARDMRYKYAGFKDLNAFLMGGERKG